jgi:hypothetical protein
MNLEINASLKNGLKAFESTDFEDAKRFFQKAIFENLGRPEPWFQLGAIQEALSNTKGSAYMYYMALDINHSYLPARQALTRLGYIH